MPCQHNSLLLRERPSSFAESFVPKASHACVPVGEASVCRILIPASDRHTHKSHAVIPYILTALRSARLLSKARSPFQWHEVTAPIFLLFTGRTCIVVATWLKSCQRSVEVWKVQKSCESFENGQISSNMSWNRAEQCHVTWNKTEDVESSALRRSYDNSDKYNKKVAYHNES